MKRAAIEMPEVDELNTVARQFSDQDRRALLVIAGDHLSQQQGGKSRS